MWLVSHIRARLKQAALPVARASARLLHKKASKLSGAYDLDPFEFGKRQMSLVAGDNVLRFCLKRTFHNAVIGTDAQSQPFSLSRIARS